MTHGQRKGRRRDGCENPVPLLVCKLPHCGSYVISRDWCSCGRGSLPGRSRQSPQVGCIERPGLHQPGEKAKGSSKDKGKRVGPPTASLSKKCDLNFFPSWFWPLRSPFNSSFYINQMWNSYLKRQLGLRITWPWSLGRWAPLGTTSILPQRTGDTVQQELLAR